MKNVILAILTIIGGILLAPVMATTLAVGPFASVGDLERYAKNELSSFDGDDESFEGDEYLNSFDEDEFVDFGGPARNWNSPGLEKDLSYVLTLVNAHAATRTAYVTPGYISDTGTATDSAFNDINNLSGLTGSGSPYGIKYFHAFINQVPTICNGIQIKSTLAGQLNEQLTIEQLSPFRQLENKIINISSFVDENSYNDKIATVPTPGLVLGSQVRVKLPIAGSSTCYVTFWIGAMLNNNKALQTKAVKGISGANRFQPSNIQRFMPPRPRLLGRR